MRTSPTDTTCRLHLLDSVSGHALQHWEFADRDQISIGRSSECDIFVTDPQVSRQHAELLFRDGQWHLRSQGRNGTWVRGLRVEEVPLADRAIFRLGATGPMLQLFVDSAKSETPSATLDNIDPHQFDFLQVNQDVVADEVDQIVSTEAFQKLRDESDRLRQTDIH